MTTKITEEIAEALRQQNGKPLQVRDAAGQVYYIMTVHHFQRYVYDDSELSEDEMLAAAEGSLDDTNDWGAPSADGPKPSPS